MSSASPNLRPHSDPLVQAFLNSQPSPDVILSAISALPESSHPKVQAIFAIIRAQAGIYTVEEASKIAQEAYQHPSHVDLHLLFLASWFSMLAAVERPPVQQLRALESSMNALVSEGSPPEIRAIVRGVQGFVSSAFFADYRKHFCLLKDNIEDVPTTSPLYSKLAVLRAMPYFAHGMGTEVAPSLAKLSIIDFDQQGIAITRFADCVLTGKLQDIAILQQEIERRPNHVYMQSLRTVYRMSCELVSLLKETGYEVPEKFSFMPEEEDPSWVLSTRALIDRDPEEALFWARQYADERSGQKKDLLDFADHVLVRAELAAGNGRAAKRLLLKLRESGTEIYFDDFYFARAELLLGNCETAALHFAKLKESVERYQAENRFNFEVSIAGELAPNDLVQLSFQATEALRQGARVQRETSRPVSGKVSTIVSVSSKMEVVKESIVNFAKLDLPVLITGETGTGKELVARAIHEHSTRNKEPFLAINCSAIPDALIESELFGHASGAFTGAQSAYRGIFREAGRGTVFLDEIADISPRLQVALLRVLEAHEVRAVGSSAVHQIDCRVLAATNRELFSIVDAGRFRSDLFFRLQRLELTIPPLRERLEDISPLTEYFLNVGREGEESAKPSFPLLERLERYDWPGNVRELRNAVERMRVMNSEKLYYDLEDLMRHGFFLVKDRQNSETSVAGSHPASSSDIADSTSGPQENYKKFLTRERPDLRRQQQICEMLEEVDRLKTSEVAAFLGVDRHTAARDLRALCNEGVLKKVTPTASSRSNYYVKHDTAESE